MAGGVIGIRGKEYDVLYFAHGGACEILTEVRDRRMKVILAEGVVSLRAELGE